MEQWVDLVMNLYYRMKRIVLTLLITLGFSQTDEWIYTSLLDSSWQSQPPPSWDSISSYRISPDDGNLEVIKQDALFSDISTDGSKILLGSNDNFGPIYLYDFFSIDTLNLNGSHPRFTADEDVMIYHVPEENSDSWSMSSLYKYSFTGDSVAHIADSLFGYRPSYFLSSNKQQLMYYKVTSQEDSLDIFITDIQSGEATKLRTIPRRNSSRNYSYWGQDGYIYLNLFDNSNIPQLFKISITNGNETPIQLTFFNDDCWLVSTSDSYLDQLALRVKVMEGLVAFRNNLWLYDLTSGELSFYHDFEYNSSSPSYQTWSPNNSKLALGYIGSSPG